MITNGLKNAGICTTEMPIDFNKKTNDEILQTQSINQTLTKN
jgi:hypothetical protein